MLRDQAARRRLELNPLTTSTLVVQQQQQQPFPHQTPSSALSQNSLSAQFGYNPSSFNPTPVSSVQQYNPQQWTSPASVTSAGPLSAGRGTDPDVTVPAPPPYSPPRSNRASMIMDDAGPSGFSPAARSPQNNMYRSSPEPNSNTFLPPPPPPPNVRNRSASQDRPQTFSLSAFTRRAAPEANVNLPDVSSEQQVLPRRPAPIMTEAANTMMNFEQTQSIEARPPAGRRAISTGGISTGSSQSRASSRSRWEPGMPLPPPPPGPPPQSRSQSMTRTDRVSSPPTRRPGHLSSLGPVPPTPAGWTDEVPSTRGVSPEQHTQVDSHSVSSSTAANSSTTGSATSSLQRTPHAVNEPKSIRERRTESKTRKAVEDRSNNPWAEAIVPSDIVVPTGLSRRQTITKSTPRSARSQQDITLLSPNTSLTTTPQQPNTGGTLSSLSRGSTPRPLNSARRSEAPTPPFSPGTLKSALSDTSLPTNSRSGSIPPPPSRFGVSASPRPVSHILNIPANEHVTIPPLTPSRSNSRASQTSHLSPAELFSRAAMERHQAFALKEAAASTDEQRVRLFADFIVTESRLRRDRYSEAVDSMGSEVLELTRDLFRPYNTTRRESSGSRSDAWTPASSAGPRSPAIRSHRGSIMAALQDGPQLQSQQERDSGSQSSSPAVTRPESTWWSGYMPSLSPIPSMSVSTALDGSDSRGRPSSRWWEVSNENESNGTPSMRLERSKRESKYMGMPRELREALQNGEPTNLSMNGMGSSANNERRTYGADEYPPEKTGWHDQNMVSPPPLDSATTQTFSPAPFTPNPDYLDVSRLVTLPPPYPRHHPAVNNNHPDLSEIRTVVRTLTDFSEVEKVKTNFSEAAVKIQDDLKSENSKRRTSLRGNIHRELQAGTMTYADAAKLEEESLVAEHEKTKEASKTEFDLFQHQVVAPLNDILMARLTQATEIFTQLRSKLFIDNQEISPNFTQEEGDEQPELLEKLTLLKWIFEARELLHRELFDLLSDRNDRYKEMVIIPYRLAKNDDKIVGAEAFFAEDANKRKLAFEQEVLKRTEEFMDIVEQNVVRGVEVQLSAFWDIAPSLSRITEKIPSELEGFHIQIPQAEYEENPEYWEFPMRYLYTLIGHCEKSSYQFIESQTNLLCLLHEVKSGVTVANCRLMKTQRTQQGEDGDVVEFELKEIEKDEENRLTADLKEKVKCVEELWTSALGEDLKTVKSRIVSFLLSKGAWEEEDE